MNDLASNDLGDLRSLTAELLSKIDAWIEGADDPGYFRHRLLRAHAVAMLDELEYLASDAVARTLASVGEPRRSAGSEGATER